MKNRNDITVKLDTKKFEIPPAKRGKGTSKYPFDSLEVGRSFLVKCKTMAPNELITLVATRYRRHPDKKFTCRNVGAQGVRVWRVK